MILLTRNSFEIDVRIFNYGIRIIKYTKNSHESISTNNYYSLFMQMDEFSLL